MLVLETMRREAVAMTGWRAGWTSLVALALASAWALGADGGGAPNPPRAPIRIVDAAGEPVPGARVWLLAPDPSEQAPRVAATMESDGEGHVPAPLMGSGWAAVAQKDTLLGWRQNLQAGRQVVLVPATGTVRGAVLLLSGRTTLDVRIRVCGIADMTGETRGGFVTIPKEVGILSTYVGMGGSFTVNGVPAGASVQLTVESDGAATIWSGYRPQRSRSATLVEFPACQVEGTVRGTTGRPVADALVEAVPEWPAQVGAIWIPRQWTRTDRAGRFRFSRLHDRTYRFLVGEPGWYGQLMEATPGTSGKTAFIKLYVDRGGRVEGRIVCSGEEGTPKRGQVTFVPVNHPQSSDWRMRADASAEGRFAITLPEGKYRLRWADLDALRVYKPEMEVTVKEGKTISVEVVIGPDTPFEVIHPQTFD